MPVKWTYAFWLFQPVQWMLCFTFALHCNQPNQIELDFPLNAMDSEWKQNAKDFEWKQNAHKKSADKNHHLRFLTFSV